MMWRPLRGRHIGGTTANGCEVTREPLLLALILVRDHRHVLRTFPEGQSGLAGTSFVPDGPPAIEPGRQLLPDCDRESGEASLAGGGDHVPG